MATLLELAKIKHHAVRSDGAKFLDGVRNDSLNTSWLTVNSSGRVTLGPGLYDEMGAPFYDPASTIAFQGQGGWIEIDNRGQRFYRYGQAEPTIEFNLQTGDGIFTGAVRAESIIIPVREA